MLISVLPALLVGLIWSRKESIPAGGNIGKKPEAAGFGSISQLIKSVSFWLLCASYSLQGYVGYIFVFWFYSYLVKVRHFALLEGAFFSSMPWLLSLISIPAGGWIADRLSTGPLGKKWGMRMVPTLGLAMAGILLALGAQTSNPYLAAIYLSFSTAFILCVEGPFWAAVSSIASEEHTGIGGGIMNTGCNIGGMISPVLTPWLAERIGWTQALNLAAMLSIMAALFWFGIRLPDRSETKVAY